MLRFVLSLSFLLGVHQIAAAAVVRVADGDCVGLAKAVAQSSSSIVLARAGRYSACSFHAQTGSVDIDAQGATAIEINRPTLGRNEFRRSAIAALHSAPHRAELKEPLL